MTFRALSLGGGQVSTALAIAIADKLVVNGYDFGQFSPLGACTFADTGGELQATYAHIERLSGYLANRGIRLDVVRANGPNLHDKVLSYIRGERNSAPPLPFHLTGGESGRALQGCTTDFKSIPLTRHVKKLAAAVGKKNDVETLIGYGIEELSRCRNDRPDGWPEGWRWRYPLIEARLGRGWCIDVCTSALGRTLPVPSACYFCPHRPDVGPGGRSWIKDNEPDTWSKLVEFDAAIRPGYKGMRARGCFISALRVPVEEALTSASAQGDFWGDCGKESGRCFT